MTKNSFLLGVHRNLVIKFSHLLFFIVILSAYTSKHSNQFKGAKELSNAEKVLNWISTQQTNAKTDQHKSKYESLKNNIDVNELWVEDIREGDKIILIPVKNGFKIKNNKNIPVSNYLFLIMDTTGSIEKGQIVQYLGNDRTKKSPLPVNTLHKHYLFEPINGQFTHLDILNTDFYLHESEYRKDKLYRYSVVDPKPKQSNTKNLSLNKEIICDTFHWYENISFVSDKDKTKESEKYLYSTYECFDSSEYRAYFVNTKLSYNRTTNIVWTVGKGKLNKTYWSVNSEEQFKGIKSRNKALNAKFISANHMKTELIAPPNFATWKQCICEVKLINDSTATASNSGSLYFNINGASGKEIKKKKSWLSYLLWP